MATNNDKAELLELINTFKALYNKVDEYAQKPQFGIESILKNNDNLTGYLLALVNVLIGVDGIRELVGSVLTKAVDKYQEQLKTRLKKTFQKQKNNGLNISQTPLNENNGGIRLKLINIDKFNKFKDKPSKKENFFNTKIREVLQTGTNLEITGSISVVYDDLTGDLIFTSVSPNTVYELFTDGLVDLISIDSNSILEEVLDSIFGLNSSDSSISNIQGKLERDKIIDLILDNRPRTITKFDFEKITQEAKIRKQGKAQLDLNCSLVTFGINETSLEVLLDKDFNTLTNEEIGQEVINLVNDGLEESGLTSDENLKDFFYNNFFQKIINILLGILVSPEYITIISLIKTLNDTNFETIINTDFIDDLSGDLVDCIIEELKEILYDEIYELLKTKIIPLVKGVIEVYIKEQADNYLAILKSIIRL